MTGETVSDRVKGHASLQRALGTFCPYLQVATSLPVDEEPASATAMPTAQKSCHAVPVPFIPSTVHQSSCCLNQASYMRCPYYVEVMGQQKRQIDLQMRKQSTSSRLRHQLARLIPFVRSDRKKRKRIYFVI
ncbi:MAG: hypothetical protein R2932_35045 [Caldilineaceae bacterium]